MDKQEVFNKVKTHLLTQNERAGREGNCQYRTSEGLKCAVGCLIEDQYYDPQIEGTGIVAVKWDIESNNPQTSGVVSVFRTILEKSHVPMNSEVFLLLSELQKLHDYLPVHTWEVNLKEIAKYHGLKYE